MSNEVLQNQAQSLPKLILLNEIGRLAISSPDLDALFRAGAELIRDRLQLQYVMIATTDYETRQIVMRAAAGVEAPPPGKYTSQGIPEGTIGDAIDSGRTIVINHASKSPRHMRATPAT